MMTNAGLNELRLAYKKAINEWVDSVRSEEALAAPDHSMIAMELWDAAHLREENASTNAAEAREAYKDGLRTINYGI